MEKQTVLDGNIYTSFPKPGRAKYDGRAKYYEWLISTNWYNLLYWNTRPKYYTEFAREPILEETGRLIDIGCGGLSQTASLYCITKNYCTLIDESIGMLNVAEGRLNPDENNFPTHIKLVQSDAFNLTLAKESFDILCSFGTIHLFDDKQEFVNTILQFLRPEGHFYFSIMTNRYVNSRLFMRILRWFGEFGVASSERELLALFPLDKFNVCSSMKGSVLFIKGQKR